MRFVFARETNSDLCQLHHKLIGFYNLGEKCLQRGTNRGFKLISLRFLFKGLTVKITVNQSTNKHQMRPYSTLLGT